MKPIPKLREKEWDQSKEQEIFRGWEREGIYKFDRRSRRKIFVIDTPPPYPSGRPWHIGAAVHYSQIDMIARTARMTGYEALFPIGFDRNGLPVEIYAEKECGISMRDTPRAEFIKACRQALDGLEGEMIEIMKAMGLSGDFSRYYRTDSEEYRSLTQSTFIKLWKKGLIYEATRPNNYCPECGTTIADAEVEYVEAPAELVYVYFKVKETEEGILVATTRPELLCSCQAVIVNPEDKRYSKYHRMHAIIPLYDREVEIRPHPSARPEFGSGAVMVCSYGDYSDVLLFRELGLKEIVAIDEQGRMTEACRYVGLTVGEARKRAVEDLQREELVKKIEKITHRTPFCERSGTSIEIIPMKEFYLKQLDLVSKIREISQRIVFHPEGHRQILLDWLDAVAIDWPISRRRYYATEIPLWYCKGCGEPHTPKPGSYYRPWIDAASFKDCRRCGGTEFVGETRTFDTWMDSSITPLFVAKYLRNKSFFRKAYPVSLRPQGKDIVRTWLYYTILRCYQLTKRAPFKHAWIMGYGLDERGQRMSKSRGNVIDPLPIIKKYGGDAFRFWGASEASLGSDFRCSEARIAGARKFINKLWNLSRFVSSFPQPKRAKLTWTDRWILSELAKLTNECMNGYADFNFFVPANRAREFTWNLFAPHYVELAKARGYGTGFTREERRAAWYTLHTCLRTILLLLAPITPFITEMVWTKLYGKRSIHLQRLPKARWGLSPTRYTEKIVDFNSSVWNRKKMEGLSLKQPISVNVPKELKPFEKDVLAMHNIKR